MTGVETKTMALFLQSTIDMIRANILLEKMETTNVTYLNKLTQADNAWAHCGMKNIESRINFLNGTFSIISSKNKGVQINFTF